MIPVKRPIPLAPAPPARGAFGANAPRVRTLEPEGELSESSSGDEGELVARAPGLYAELEGASEEEVEAEEPLVEEEEQPDRDEIIRARVIASKEQMKEILGSLTSEQLARYETFRRQKFPQQMIKKVLQRILDNLNSAGGGTGGGGGGGKDKASLANSSINSSALIVAAGIAKVFVGELVEEARVVMEEWNDDPQCTLMPSHVMEAYRRLKQCGKIPHSSNYRKHNSLGL